MKQKFSITELQTISFNAGTLRACPAITFRLANAINGAKVKADAALNIIQESVKLINERRNNDNQAECDKDFQDLINKPVSIEFEFVNVADFAGLEIAGEKAVQQQNGEVLTFPYRDAYFSLLGLVIK